MQRDIVTLVPEQLLPESLYEWEWFLKHLKHLDGFCEPNCGFCVERPGWDE